MDKTSADFPAYPVFAGVCDCTSAQKIGMSVAETSDCLRRILFVKRKLAWSAACHLNSTPEWEIKAALALHSFLDMQHADRLRHRMLELRQNPKAVEEIPHTALAALLDEAIYSEDSIELLTAIYQVLRPALLDAISWYLSAANPLADQPSCRVLKLLRMEEEEMVSWGNAALQSTLATKQGKSLRNKSEKWAAHLRSYLAAAGGIAGKETPAKASRAERRATVPYKPDLTPRRDARFHGLYDSSIPADAVYADESRSAEERNLALLFKRVREMDVPETIAAILAESPDEPWEYQMDMYRQMWDEARHALIGQAALQAHGADWTSLPINVTFSYKLGKYLNARERHLLLYGIEQSLMPAKTGKRYEYEIARASGDRLSTTFQDFDWADEVLHAAIGRRQLRRYFPAEQREMLRRADELVKRIAQGIETDGMPEAANARDAQAAADWWERFAEEALGHPVPPAPQTHLKDWKPLSS